MTGTVGVTMRQVYLTKEMHERGHPVLDWSGFWGGHSNSSPMESFTFQTGYSEQVYNGILKARLGLVLPAPSTAMHESGG